MEKNRYQIVIKALADGDIISAEALDEFFEIESNTNIKIMEMELEREKLRGREKERNFHKFLERQAQLREREIANKFDILTVTTLIPVFNEQKNFFFSLKKWLQVCLGQGFLVFTCTECT